MSPEYFRSDRRDARRAAAALQTLPVALSFKFIVDEEERAFLERLFAWTPPYSTDSRRRTRSAKAAVRASQNPVPRDVFKLVMSFWKPKREAWWQGGGRYDHYMTHRTYRDPGSY